mgnify:CR=1 FL=1
MKIVVVSGGFDPIHSGHIAYFKAARSHGDKLVIALNSDAWLENKKGLVVDGAEGFESPAQILDFIKRNV